MEEKLLKIINHYKVIPQLKKLSEEVFELQEAIINYQDEYSLCDKNELYTKKHIAEELADVMVLLCQFKEFYRIDSNEILKMMNMKIDRQLERIKNEKIF